MELVLSKESAEAEFDRFLVAAEIEVIDDDDLKDSFTQSKNRVIRALQTGRVIIDEEGLPTLLTKNGQSIKYNLPMGSTYTAMDGKKDGQNFARMNAAMADVTKLPASTFTRLCDSDYKIAMAIMSIFLAA